MALPRAKKKISVLTGDSFAVPCLQSERSGKKMSNQQPVIGLFLKGITTADYFKHWLYIIVKFHLSNQSMNPRWGEYVDLAGSTADTWTRVI